MRAVSLFSGVGLMDLGLSRAGFEVVSQTEIDPYARAVLEARFPGVVRFEDVRSVRADDVAAGGPVDLIAGGFPCQDVSSANPGGAGLDGERSGLWAEYARLVAEARPRWVLIENVAKLRNKGLDRVLGDLAARGYDAEWDVVGAAAVGAPHLRERIWIVAWDPARVRVPDPSGEPVRVERERKREQRREPRADEPGDDGAHGRMAGPMADGDGARRGVERSGGILDGERPAHGDDADRCGAPVADAVRAGREGAAWAQGSSDAAAPGHGGSVSDARFRIFDADVLAAWRERCEREVWPKAGAQSGLGRDPDGRAEGLELRPVQAWEAGTPRSLTFEEAAERKRTLGELRSHRLRGIGNGVLPQIVEFIGRRIRLADELFGGTT